jgi:hypothetical protein
VSVREAGTRRLSGFVVGLLNELTDHVAQLERCRKEGFV